MLTVTAIEGSDSMATVCYEIVNGTLQGRDVSLNVTTMDSTCEILLVHGTFGS